MEQGATARCGSWEGMEKRSWVLGCDWEHPLSLRNR